MNKDLILEDIYYSFQRCINLDNAISGLTVEQFLAMHKHFYYNNRCFIFRNEIKVSNNTYKEYKFILSLYYSKPVEGDSVIVRYHIETIKILFPFLDIKVNEYGEYFSDIIESKLLLKTLPTRINIITRFIEENNL